MFPSLTASAFGDFLKNYYPWIIVGVTILVVLIIILITVRIKKKPSAYKSDEIDATVDKAAKEKSIRHEQSESRPQAAPEPKNQPEPVQRHKTEPAATQPQTKTESVATKSEEAKRPQPTKQSEETKPKQKTEQKVEPVKTEPVQAEASAKEDNMGEAKKIDYEAFYNGNINGNVEKKDEQIDREPEEEEASGRPQSYRIIYDKETETWEVRKDNAKRVIRRVKTKKEALEIAKELSQNQDLNLVVHKKDGKFQKKR